MKTEAIDLSSLQQFLERQVGSAGDNGSEVEPEHPLARRLRTVLENPSAHRIGDLARVVEHIMREMSMVKAADDARDTFSNGQIAGN
jgi:hypothetical protein